MKTIEFKSSPEFFNDECIGLKNNTVRFTDDWNTGRFADFNFATHIKIINSETKECFIRKIRHKCRYKNLAVITWNNESQFNNAQMMAQILKQRLLQDDNANSSPIFRKGTSWHES